MPSSKNVTIETLIKNVIKALEPSLEKYAVVVCHDISDLELQNDPHLITVPPSRGDQFSDKEITDRVQGREAVLILADLFNDVDLKHMPIVIGFLDQCPASPPILILFVCPTLIKNIPNVEPIILERTLMLLQLGADNVIWNQIQYHRKGPSLTYQIEISLLRIQNSMTRMSQQLQASQMVNGVDQEYAEKLERKYHKMMWSYVIKRVLVHFPPCDPSLDDTESSHGVGDYRFSTMLGEGRMGTIYRATHKSNHMDGLYSVTVIPKSRIRLVGELESLYREYRFLTKMVKHPNIVKGEEMLHASKNLYFVTEYVGFRNLYQLLANEPHKRLALPMTKKLTTQLTAAVAHLHLKGICHRDLKSEGLIVMESHELKVVDFGTAVMLQMNERLKTPCGTLPYAAPEVHMEETPYCGFKADLWSLGVVLTDMLVGSRSFEMELGWQATDKDINQAHRAHEMHDLINTENMIRDWINKREFVSEGDMHNALHFLSVCLCADPSVRMSARHLRKLPFVADTMALPTPPMTPVGGEVLPWNSPVVLGARQGIASRSTARQKLWELDKSKETSKIVESDP